MPDIYISSSDLKTPHVDEVVAMEAAAKGQEGATFIENVDRPLFYNPMFYYGIAAAFAAFLAWAILEPHIIDSELSGNPIIGFLVFMLTAALIGLALGTVYGVANRNPGQSLYCGAVGLGVGLLAAIPATVLGGIVFMIGLTLTASLLPEQVESIQDFPPLAFFALICTRSCTWAIVAAAAGFPLGVSLKSGKLISVGVIGGIIGGAVGGLFFDPVDRFLSFNPDEAWLSRMIGLTAVGLLAGLFIGYIENLAKTAWLQMLRGPLTGKHFNLFKSPTMIGSSPRADIYLFKDADISPEHASISISGSKFLLADLNSKSGVFVNGKRVTKAVLQRGDIVTLGQTVLKYDDKEKRG